MGKKINKDWWLLMAEKAKREWQNYSFRMYYMEVEDYCRVRAQESNN